MHYDEVAVDRAVAGDTTVRLLDGEREELVRRARAGLIEPTALSRLIRVSGATARRLLEAEG